jgi:YegS/Rv2252/BmrU family lipid kinase
MSLNMESQTTEKTSELNSTKSVYVIFNPVSAAEDPELRKQAISDAFAEHGYGCQWLVTSQEHGGKELAAQALQEGVDLIAVSGGDGTVIETISALVGTDVPLAVIPAGTGNLLSVNLGIPRTVPEAVHVALSGKPYKLDLAKTQDGEYFAIMGGVGIDASMIADAGREAKRRFGVLAYFVAALKNLSNKGMFVHVSIDNGKPIRKRAKTVIIANMGKVTGGFEVMPPATPNDGLLDIGILRSQTLFHWLRLLGFALLGRAQDDPDFDVYQGKHIEIRMAREQPFELDGEECGQANRLVIDVVPLAVNILLPADSDAAAAAKSHGELSTQQQPSSLPVGLALAAGITGIAGWFIWKKVRDKKK